MSAFPTRILCTVTKDEAIKHLSYARSAWQSITPQPGRMTEQRNMAVDLIEEGYYVAPPDPVRLDTLSMETSILNARRFRIVDEDAAAAFRNMSTEDYSDFLNEGKHLLLPEYIPG